MDGEGTGAKEALNWHEYFTYNPETGDLIWKERPESHFKRGRRGKSHSTWNSCFSGKIAGRRVTTAGRPSAVTVVLNYRPRLVHRIIWEMHNGPIPDGMEIDHINGNPWDNRMGNLRLATRAENGRNRKKSKSNTSGHKGIIWLKDKNRWEVRVFTDGRLSRFGTFRNLKDAVTARDFAYKKMHGQFRRTD